MAQQSFPSALQSTILHSDRLTVEIASPGSLYRGTRFDWSGFIIQVTLDEAHTFCTSESLQPGAGTGGIGLCNEFGNEKPIGFVDAKPLEAFPKLGIGLLRRPDRDAYSYLRPYEIVQLFPTHVSTHPDQVSILVEPVDCRGYSARLKKTITVKGNGLEISYQLENTGSQTIDTHEYCHNFIGIDRQYIGPDYRLTLPYRVEMEKIASTLRGLMPVLPRKLLPGVLLDKLIEAMLQQRLRPVTIDGGDVGFRYTPQTPFYFRTSGFSQSQGPQWEIRLLSGGVGLREYDDFAPARVAVWGDGHVLSAETFIDIHLQPGEVKVWLRRYEFFKETDSL